MYHSKHASFSRRMEQYPIQSDAIMSYTHIHTHARTGSGQFCLCGTARSFSFTAQHFKRLITDTDWQDKMNPLKSAHKQSSRHSGSREHTQTSNNSPDCFFPIDGFGRLIMLQFCILSCHRKFWSVIMQCNQIKKRFLHLKCFIIQKLSFHL